jgi:hypothetical protein
LQAIVAVQFNFDIEIMAPTARVLRRVTIV